MKKSRCLKYAAAALLVLILLPVCLSSCGQIAALPKGNARLVFIDERINENVDVELTEEESARLREIFEGKNCDDPFSVPSCGFTTDVSIRFGSEIFCPACDGCNGFRWGLIGYFDVTPEEINWVHALFEKYGGFFPCI